MGAIVEAAAQVFERHGYAAGTTNRIAHRAGVSIGSLYQYFPNKDAILIALVRRHLAEATATLRPELERLSAGEPLDDVLPRVVEAMVGMHALAPRLHRVLFEETPLPRSLRKELDHLEDETVEVVAAALRAERVPPSPDPRLSARVIVSMIEGLTHRLTLRPISGVTSGETVCEITAAASAYLHARAALP